jgi:hypothetical protein
MFLYIVNVLGQICSQNLVMWDFISVVFHYECTVQAWTSFLNMVYLCYICVHVHVYICLYWINDNFYILSWFSYDGSIEK